MKKFLMLLCAVMLTIVVVGNTSAVTMKTEDISLNSYADGDFLFNINGENASYESEFGLFTQNIDKTYTFTKIFNKTNEPGFFSIIGIVWSDYDGFYADVYTGGSNDNSVDHRLLGIFVGDDNPYDQDYFQTSFDEDTGASYIGIDDQIRHCNGCGYCWCRGRYWDDNDFDDMQISITPVVSPVPEPATMLLLGTGLLGMAGLGRKKVFKK